MIFYYQYFLIHLKSFRSSADQPGKEVDSRLLQALFERAGFREVSGKAEAAVHYLD
jgi:hypothetical protein